MKPLEQRIANTPAPRLQAELEALVATLFRRFPTLMGFSVQDAGEFRAERSAALLEGDLCLVDVETFPWDTRPAELFGEIAVPLLELIDEAPTARELLRGRTFARTFH